MGFFPFFFLGLGRGPGPVPALVGGTWTSLSRQIVWVAPFRDNQWVAIP